MKQSRVMPCLLISGNGLVKTKNFKNPVYVGDPVNSVKIFSDKEADEIVILDIDASRKNKDPNFELISEMAGEAFMPVAYGGGIKNIDHIRRLIRSGVEKVVINTQAIISTDIIKAAVDIFGSQAVVGAVDVRRKLLGSYAVFSKGATVDARISLQDHIEKLLNAGVGELFINDVDRDGAMNGYDINLLSSVSRQSPVPVVICGGAGSMEHLREGVHIGGASGVAAGSMFVFHGKHRAVLISYPKVSEIKKFLSKE